MPDQLCLSEPFLKWAGGKRWLAPAIVAALRDVRFNRYFEPFLGGGALFFSLRPDLATLADVNGDLINVFRQVRRAPRVVARALESMPISPSYYLKVRETVPATPLSNAVRLLYLNRTAFNGLYRVNQRGGFNVPFGCKPTTKFPDAATMQAISRALRGVALMTSGYVETMKHAVAGDLIYADPPYTVKHDNNAFRRYNERLFTWTDQERLAAIATELVRSRVHVIVTNANHPAVRALYCSCHFAAFRVTRASNMAATASARGLARECVFVSRTIVDSHRTFAKRLGDRVRTEALPLSTRCREGK